MKAGVMEDFPKDILAAHDDFVDRSVGPFVDFAPEPHQLTRKPLDRRIPRWQIAAPIVAFTLGMIGWLASRPGVAVAHGAVSLAQPAETTHKIELFQLPEWHDEPVVNSADTNATPNPTQTEPMQTADVR